MKFNEAINNFSINDPIQFAMAIVGLLIGVMSIFALIVSIRLAISYVKYNRKQNSINLSGEKIARKILDLNGLNNIAVKTTGSIMFGNSYSHYFHKVRLRRRTTKKSSVSALAMSSQKSALAVLDKENDPDMKKRIKLTPIITLGPLAFIPLVIIGIILDIVTTSNIGKFSIIFAVVGFLFYVISFVMSVLVLKTEKKAQIKAIEILQKENMATPEEILDLSALFHLYNIEYINDMIISMLEMIYYALRILAIAKGEGGNLNKRN